MPGLRVPVLGQDTSAKEMDLGTTLFDLEVHHSFGDAMCPHRRLWADAVAFASVGVGPALGSHR